MRRLDAALDREPRLAAPDQFWYQFPKERGHSAWYSSAKIEQKLGFKPEWNLEKAMPEMVAELRRRTDDRMVRLSEGRKGGGTDNRRVGMGKFRASEHLLI